MRILAVIVALSLTLGGPAIAFDAATQAIIAHQKSGKPVPIADVQVLMLSSESWCYLEDANSCAWSEIYLSMDADGAAYESSDAWNETIDIAYVDHGRFAEGGVICDTDIDWLPNMRAVRRDDGSMVSGRALRDLKTEIAAALGAPSHNCYDYIYRGADPAAQTLTLLQRQSTDGVHDPEQDTLVSLQFDPDTAAALTLRW